MRVLPLFLAATALLAYPQAAARAATLDTQVSLLVGFPAEDAGAAKGKGRRHSSPGDGTGRQAGRPGQSEPRSRWQGQARNLLQQPG